jgi:hypothetical protein
LDYEITDKKDYFFIRARLVKDNGGFALRDNFKVLKVVPGGMEVTVIDYIYPLSPIVRALGPALRETLRDELNKLNVLEKCFVEEGNTFPPADSIFTLCHSRIKTQKI